MTTEPPVLAIDDEVMQAMVASGLVDRPAVSHYRLAAHLLLAVNAESATVTSTHFAQRDSPYPYHGVIEANPHPVGLRASGLACSCPQRGRCLHVYSSTI